ncbi:hypothetical protein M011DRAFT_161469 [Sporormia fimetaria CBS 119925]|uniref:Uncharacterized protein n=1 Tax=Sporormia fimetaria CBS 119925 TaxID=1340428 RepID=A0A6A6V578_9PLEO|nr:hypothetical protein M011DRAFT_161469 [Sporormia fimetaria CBS 119925]
MTEHTSHQGQDWTPFTSFVAIEKTRTLMELLEISLNDNAQNPTDSRLRRFRHPIRDPWRNEALQPCAAPGTGVRTYAWIPYITSQERRNGSQKCRCLATKATLLHTAGITSRVNALRPSTSPNGIHLPIFRAPEHSIRAKIVQKPFHDNSSPSTKGVLQCLHIRTHTSQPYQLSQILGTHPALIASPTNKHADLYTAFFPPDYTRCCSS